MVSISLRSFGLTIAEVRPCIIAIATIAESMIGRMCLRHTVGVVGQTTCRVQTHIREHLDTLKNLHLFVLHSLYNQEQRIKPQIL